MALIEEGEEEIEESTSKYTLSPFVYPLRYRINLTPIFVNHTISKIHGRIVIEFQQNDSQSLDKLILNAKNIKTVKYRLVSLNTDTKSRKRRVPEEDDNPTTGLSVGDEMNITTTDNPTGRYTNFISDNKIVYTLRKLFGYSKTFDCHPANENCLLSQPNFG